VMFCFLGEFWASTLNYEENWIGGIEFWEILGFCSRLHVVLLRRGDAYVNIIVLGEVGFVGS
jgi:hypothetical protein